MADTRTTLRAPVRAAALPASGIPLSIAVLQTLASCALQDAIALIDAPSVSTATLERALGKAMRARTHLKRAIRAQEGSAA